MASAKLGKDSIFKVDNSGGTLTNLHGAGNGLMSVTYNLSQGSREIPGGGSEVRRQTLGKKDLTVTVQCDENSVTEPVFGGGAEGDTRSIEIGPGGSSTGYTKITAEMLIESVQETSPHNDAVTYSVQMVLADSLTVGSY